MEDETFTLEWKNLSLQTKKTTFNIWQCKSFHETKTILNDVSGTLKSGQLVAILGNSGAGKTTLLAAISYRFRGPLSGQLLLNNTQIDRKTMTKISCFVPQFDILLDTLTPMEHLHFMAELKLDRRWTHSRKCQRVMVLLRELGLQQVADSRIATLSGGERKKLNLATDLLTNPPIMFCDEVTTGLDSFNARKVIEALRYLSSTSNNMPSSETADEANELQMYDMASNRVKCSQPKAIICSIHQPTSDIFQCFSQITLMHGGRCVFQGKTDDAFDYFFRLGFSCPPSYNPADFFIRVLSQTEQQSDAVHVDINLKQHRNSCDKHISDPVLEDFMNKTYKGHNSFWIKQVLILFLRSTLNMKRNAMKLLITLAFQMIPYTAMGLLYVNLIGNTQDDVQNIQGVLFMLISEVMYSTMYRILNFYLASTPLLRRESNEHIYTVSAYYVACNITEFPIQCIRPFFGLLITYNLAGFSKGIIFFLEMWVSLVCLAITANAYGLMLAGIFRSVILEIPTVFNLIFISISGAYASLVDYPLLKYISLFFHAYEAMSIFYWYDVRQIECSSRIEGLCLRNGTEVLTNINFNTNIMDVWMDFFGLIMLSIGMHIAALIGIQRFIRSDGYY